WCTASVVVRLSRTAALGFVSRAKYAGSCHTPTSQAESLLRVVKSFSLARQVDSPIQICFFTLFNTPIASVAQGLTRKNFPARNFTRPDIK
ncbi:hypothetical protein, partial [Rivihabitans pingtungensis]|uniref:hypothetical protein n=1 Tax=Rivihabitans pingtungensis TaxID=1054498 RepID=UPI002FD94694